MHRIFLLLRRPASRTEEDSRAVFGEAECAAVADRRTPCGIRGSRRMPVPWRAPCRSQRYSFHLAAWRRLVSVAEEDNLRLVLVPGQPSHTCPFRRAARPAHPRCRDLTTEDAVLRGIARRDRIHHCLPSSAIENSTTSAKFARWNRRDCGGRNRCRIRVAAGRGLPPRPPRRPCWSAGRGLPAGGSCVASGPLSSTRDNRRGLSAI